MKLHKEAKVNNLLLTVNSYEQLRAFNKQPFDYLALQKFCFFGQMFHINHTYSNAVPDFSIFEYVANLALIVTDKIQNQSFD